MKEKKKKQPLYVLLQIKIYFFYLQETLGFTDRSLYEWVFMVQWEIPCLASDDILQGSP